MEQTNQFFTLHLSLPWKTAQQEVIILLTDYIFCTSLISTVSSRKKIMNGQHVGFILHKEVSNLFPLSSLSPSRKLQYIVCR